MNLRTPVLVWLPADMLTDLDTEAKAKGITRTDIIRERCAQPLKRVAAFRGLMAIIQANPLVMRGAVPDPDTTPSKQKR